FRLADGVLRTTSVAEPAFNRFARANTGLADDVEPIEVEFVRPLSESAVQPKPFVFLLVIDSLRPDYLAPYNGRVTFTPRIAEFPADSFVFRNAFTRYGGTGLAMPAIWMGSAGVHKQYVHPFAPLNALE